MKAGVAISFSVFCVVAGLFYGSALGQSDPVAVNSADLQSNLVASPAATGSAVGNAGDSTHTYVGSNKCKMCHLPVYRSWAKTKMGKAFDTLKPGKMEEAKQKQGLDPEKDYTTDKKCLSCHTTGFGHEGGYAVPDPDDKKAVRRAKKLANVGCESCHGPGSAYIEVFKDIFKTKRKYKVEELYAAGLRKIDASACTDCHNEKSPTFDAAHPFNFEEMKTKGTHEHKPLKQREG